MRQMLISLLEGMLSPTWQRPSDQKIQRMLAQVRGSTGSAIERPASSWQEHVAAYPRQEFLAAYREAHAALHRLWTAAIDMDGYNKTDWKIIDNALGRFARDAAEKVGISRSEALL